MSADEIHNAVAARYDQVASTPEGQFGFPVGKEFAIKLGYSADVLAKMPDTISESFTGAGNPHGFAQLCPGDTLLDMGCGAGLDLCIYARQVTRTGRVIGVDRSPQMIAKTGLNVKSLGITWAELLCSGVEKIPIDNNTVDVVTANGILNLSPDKDAVLKEAARILKPGGQMVFSEIVLTESIANVPRNSIDDWFRCIGGAETLDSLLIRFRKCGYESARALSLTRNARTGHENSRSAVICARTPGS